MPTFLLLDGLFSDITAYTFPLGSKGSRHSIRLLLDLLLLFPVQIDLGCTLLFFLVWIIAYEISLYCRLGLDWYGRLSLEVSLYWCLLRSWLLLGWRIRCSLFRYRWLIITRYVGTRYEFLILVTRWLLTLRGTSWLIFLSTFHAQRGVSWWKTGLAIGCLGSGLR